MSRHYDEHQRELDEWFEAQKTSHEIGGVTAEVTGRLHSEFAAAAAYVYGLVDVGRLTAQAVFGVDARPELALAIARLIKEHFAEMPPYDPDRQVKAAEAELRRWADGRDDLSKIEKLITKSYAPAPEAELHQAIFGSEAA